MIIHAVLLPLLAVLLMPPMLLRAPCASAAEITGAGASFPAPLYTSWASSYQRQHGVRVNYQSVGSGGGIRQVRAGTVDFGATDMPLAPDVLAREGLIQFPTVIGGVVPVVHLPGVAPGALALSGPLLADIFLGRVRRWDDGRIAALNPGLPLPAAAIAVVRRADASGTTFIFTSYLSAVSAHWAQDIGAGSMVSWPVGIGGKGNEGVAAYVQRLPHAVGYVEYAYARQNGLAHVTLHNRDGHPVAPSAAAFAAAAAEAAWSPSRELSLVDQPGRLAWPISGATFILMHRRQPKPERGRAVLAFFDWALHQGAARADALGYAPLPEGLMHQVEASWRGLRGPAGESLW